MHITQPASSVDIQLSAPYLQALQRPLNRSERLWKSWLEDAPDLIRGFHNPAYDILKRTIERAEGIIIASPQLFRSVKLSRPFDLNVDPSIVIKSEEGHDILQGTVLNPLIKKSEDFVLTIPPDQQEIEFNNDPGGKLFNIFSVFTSFAGQALIRNPAITEVSLIHLNPIADKSQYRKEYQLSVTANRGKDQVKAQVDLTAQEAY